MRNFLFVTVAVFLLASTFIIGQDEIKTLFGSDNNGKSSKTNPKQMQEKKKISPSDYEGKVFENDGETRESNDGSLHLRHMTDSDYRELELNSNAGQIDEENTSDVQKAEMSASLNIQSQKIEVVETSPNGNIENGKMKAVRRVVQAPSDAQSTLQPQNAAVVSAEKISALQNIATQLQTDMSNLNNNSIEYQKKSQKLTEIQVYLNSL